MKGGLTMITIRVCRLDSGCYVGLKFSDRYNLHVLATDFGCDINEFAFGDIREAIRPLGFKIVSMKAGTAPVLARTEAETEATGTRIASEYDFTPCYGLKIA